MQCLSSAVECSDVQTGGASAKAAHLIYGLDRCEVDNGPHTQQRVLPGIPASEMGAVLDSMVGAVLCPPLLRVILVCGGGSGANPQDIQIQQKSSKCFTW
jgi:hypothetical protein